MTLLTSLARTLAVHRGHAQRITTVRHLHISRTPMVMIPLKMAGEANAPMAVMIGTDRDRPRLLVVAQPRNRDQRFEFAHKLARILQAEIMARQGRRESVPAKAVGGSSRCTDAVQIWVPNRAAIEFIRLLGRSTRLRRTTGPSAVPPNIPTMGKWLTYYADRSQYPGSSLLVAATTALSLHWATGQSDAEDEHLGTLLAWIDPGELGGTTAAAAAEDPVDHPPAGPSTDPTFDNTVLAPLIQRYHESPPDGSARRTVEVQIERELRKQLDGTWQQMWQAIDVLNDLSPGEHVSQRWEDDLDSFTRTADWIADTPAAQPRRDSAVAAARRLHDLERHQASYDAQRAFDDPMVMAEARMLGEAFVGTVLQVDANLRIGRRKVPRILVDTADPVRFAVGQDGLRSRARPRQKAEVLDIVAVGDRSQILLELSEGMGTRTAPEPGTVPAVGESMCYSLFVDDFRRPPVLPPREETPWTHGGPPADYIPTDQDAREDWS